MRNFEERKRYGAGAVFARRKNGAGFTLVETLIAVAILSLMVVLPLSIASRGLAKITTGKDRLIALALAREGIEYVRNVVDENRMYNMDNPNSANPRDWLEGVGSLMVDTLPANTTGANFLGGFDTYVRSDTTGNKTGLYGMSTGECPLDPSVSECWVKTKFQRTMQVNEIVSGREAVIKATVEWFPSLSPPSKKVIITESLFNW